MEIPRVAIFVYYFQVKLKFEMFVVCVEVGKPEIPKENPRSKDESQNQTQLACDISRGDRALAKAVGGEHSPHPTPFRVP